MKGRVLLIIALVFTSLLFPFFAIAEDSTKAELLPLQSINKALHKATYATTYNYSYKFHTMNGSLVISFESGHSTTSNEQFSGGYSITGKYTAKIKSIDSNNITLEEDVEHLGVFVLGVKCKKGNLCFFVESNSSQLYKNGKSSNDSKRLSRRHWLPLTFDDQKTAQHVAAQIKKLVTVSASKTEQ